MVLPSTFSLVTKTFDTNIFIRNKNIRQQHRQPFWLNLLSQIMGFSHILKIYKDCTTKKKQIRSLHTRKENYWKKAADVVTTKTKKLSVCLHIQETFILFFFVHFYIRYSRVSIFISLRIFSGQLYKKLAWQENLAKAISSRYLQQLRR